jgi:hypothetical protein
MGSLIQYVIHNVDPKTYYKEVFPDAVWGSGNEARVKSPFVEEKVPSFSINGETGAWCSFCASDSRGGKSIVSFHAELHEITSMEAAKQIFHTHIHPTIPDKIVRRYVRQLKQSPSVIRYIRSRVISTEIINRHRLGWNGHRITFPIYNEFGLCVNIKMYLPNAKGKIAKMIHYTQPDETRSYGSPPMFYPLSIFDNDPRFVVLCEGEWDTLNLLSMGIPAITGTGGAGVWPIGYTEFFKNRDVYVAYDNDPPGREGEKLVFKNLVNLAKSILSIQVPKKFGKDLNDYFKKHRKALIPAWESLQSKAKLLINNPDSLVTGGDAELVSLDQVSQARYYRKRVMLDGLITGKDISPYILPKKFRISCQNAQCSGCPIAENPNGVKDFNIHYDESSIISMLDSTEVSIKKKLLSIAKLLKEKDCRAKLTILESFNVENIMVIPTLDSDSKQYVMRSVYYIGHGLKTNKAYRFEGISLPNPKDQHATCLFDTAKPVQDEIESFELTEQIAKKLKRFRPRKLKLLAHLMSIAEWQSRIITKIHERPDLHIAVDLAFHSVPSFTFNREFVHRGMLDILVLGDTRCGKGFVTAGLNRYYRVGEIASGDNCSFAGLVGGLQQSGNRWFITWGLIPLNHNRIVIIDEASSLSEKEIGKMSRIRSEGVAEISKIIRESTQANTRLIWLANPRSGRSLITYNTGVEAIPELIGAMEDISRFDFVLTVANNEVPSDVINVQADYDTSDAAKYTQEMCQSLILWAWSRSPDQIHFTDSATKAIIREAIRFGSTYSPRIPLVQVENIRIKLAKVAAAVAARTFSTDEAYQNLIIDTTHVQCACQFLRMIYAKQSMAYDMYSKMSATASSIDDIGRVDKIMSQLGDFRDSTISGMLELNRVTVDNLTDYTGDTAITKNLIGDLVRLRCLTRTEGSNWYIKNPAFSQWLRQNSKPYQKERRSYGRTVT